MRTLFLDMDKDDWHQFRQHHAYEIENKICEETPAIVDIVLDDCEFEWNSHFDPPMDILFGKGGLSQDLWRG